MTDESRLHETLPALQRLALAYCTKAARPPTLALFALDTRLASLIRNSSEPMLARLRLAWWRETLAREPAQWPEGEPLLIALRSWDGHQQALLKLVDGWEAMTDPAPLPREAMSELAAARGVAFGALCPLVGVPQDSEAAARRGRDWALADIASRLTLPDEKSTAMALVGEQDWKRGGLSRRMRPLAVLHGLAARSVKRGQDSGQIGPLTLLAAIRLGLLGR